MLGEVWIFFRQPCAWSRPSRADADQRGLPPTLRSEFERAQLDPRDIMKTAHARRSIQSLKTAVKDMQSLKGHLLIATPQLDTPMFAQAVILMLEHTTEGAMGVILNQPISTLITDLAGRIFEEDFEWDKPLHLGGPVPGSLIVLHTLEDLGDQEILAGVFVTLEPSTVQQIIRQRPEPSLVIANYSAWGPGQLEEEFHWDSWITLPATSDRVFWTGEKDLWKVVVGEVNAKKLSEFLGLKTRPADPRLN
jgi:putative transcriptional regulator